MKYSVFTVALALAAIGCGSGETSRLSRTGSPEAGAAGSTSETGGANTGGSSTGGVVSTGGQAGSATETGGTGGGAGAIETGGSGGSCTPKTCETIAADLTGYNPTSGDPLPKACGVIMNDGCGNVIDCGGCGDWESCGAGMVIPDPNFHLSGITETQGIPNICGGNCVEWIPSSAGGPCNNSFPNITDLTSVRYSYCPYMTGNETSNPFSKLGDGTIISDESGSFFPCANASANMNCCVAH